MEINNNREVSFNNPPPVEGKKEGHSKTSVQTHKAHQLIHGDGASPSKIHTVSKESFAPISGKGLPSVNAGKLASAMKKKSVQE